MLSWLFKAAARRKAAGKTGFTLIEVLVILVLVGIASTLLFQLFSQLLHLRTKFTDALDRSRTGVLETHWFRLVCQQFIIDEGEDDAGFKGTERLIKGRALVTLEGGYGAASPVMFRLVREDGKVRLLYEEEGYKEWELGSWEADRYEFKYLSEEGKWRRSWPPTVGDHKQVPAGILLNVNAVEGPVVWFVANRCNLHWRKRSKNKVLGE